MAAGALLAMRKLAWLRRYGASFEQEEENEISPKLPVESDRCIDLELLLLARGSGFQVISHGIFFFGIDEIS